MLQKYNGFSQALEILHGIDLSNKVAIVTGANSGIGVWKISTIPIFIIYLKEERRILICLFLLGYETAYSLALHGCKVIFACRLLKNAKEAVSRVKKVRSKANCEAMKLDLSSINAVKEFCDNFKKEYRYIDEYVKYISFLLICIQCIFIFMQRTPYFGFKCWYFWSTIYTNERWF